MTAAQRKFSGPVGCDIWTIRLDRLDAARLKALSHVLSPLEHTQVARLRREHDRLRALASRGVLRYLLSAYSGVPAERLSIDRACPRCGDPHGRPLMRDGEWTASVTHSADTLAVAVARGRPIGLDLEHTDTDQHPANLVELILTPTERQDYASSPRTGLPLLLSYWTHKEAVLKCTGKGLRTPSTPLALSLAPPGPVQQITLPPADNGAAPTQLVVASVDLGPSTAAALATTAPWKHNTVREVPLGLFTGDEESTPREVANSPPAPAAAPAGRSRTRGLTQK